MPPPMPQTSLPDARDPGRELLPARAFAHPLWLAMVALLVANNFAFKGGDVLPGLLTGKLSDVAGLIVFPTVLAALFAVRTRRGLLVAFLATGATFALINVSPGAAAAFDGLLALTPVHFSTTVDPSDLLTLPALALSWRVLVPLMTRPVDLAPPLRASLAVLGGLACIAHDDVEPGPQTIPQTYTTLVIGNDTPESVVVRVRPLKPSVYVDCASVLASPSTVLSRELFDKATVWLIDPGRSAAFAGELSPSSPLDLTACWVFLVDGGGLPMRTIAWSGGVFQPDWISTSVDESDPSRTLRVETAAESAYRWGSHIALGPPPPANDPPAAPGCAVPIASAGVAWSRLPIAPGSGGEATIQAMTLAPDGCTAFDLRFANGTEIRWYLCIPPKAQIFEVGDALFVSSLLKGQEFEAIDGVELAGSGKRMRIAIGGDVAPFGDGKLTFEPAPNCSGHHDTCGNLIVPLEATFVDASGASRTLEVGDHTTVEGGGTLHLLRAQDVPVGDTECLPEGAASERVIESLYVDASDSSGGSSGSSKGGD